LNLRWAFILLPIIKNNQMDIKQYQIDREHEFNEFQSEYTDLKTQYTSLLTEVINDSSKLQDVLDTNKHLNDLITDFISKSRTKFDERVIQDLTNDIILYQKEYHQLKNSKKASEDAEKILNKEIVNLYGIQMKFNIFLLLLFLCILFIIYLIFKVPKQSVLMTPIFQPLSTLS